MNVTHIASISQNKVVVFIDFIASPVNLLTNILVEYITILKMIFLNKVVCLCFDCSVCYGLKFTAVFLQDNYFP